MTTIRDHLMAECEWGIGHEPLIHYAMTRPIDVEGWKAHRLPWSGDCSGAIKSIGLACGIDFDGQGRYGNTATLLAAGEHIRLHDALPGDVGIFVGADFTHQHAVMLMDPGASGNPYVFSHGQEAGPLRIRLLTEQAAHEGVPLVFVRYVSDSPQTWVVKGGGGKAIAHVKHPARWASEHPHQFRDHDQLIFEKE